MAKKKAKVTGWFPPHIKPVHVGVYQVKFNNGPRAYEGYAFWCGGWGSLSTTRDGAERFFISIGTDGAHQNKTWRGLAEDPTKGNK